MDIRKYNRSAWDQEVDRGNKWTLPVSDEEIAAARAGVWDNTYETGPKGMVS